VAERLERLRSDHSVLGGAGSGLGDCKSLAGRLDIQRSMSLGIREMRSDLHRLGAGQVSTFPAGRRACLTVCSNASVSFEKT
jgi:hypothetical protein